MKDIGDEGVSYGHIMSVVFVIFASIIIALMSPMINGLIGFENDLSSTGGVSVQSHSIFAWNIGWFAAIPIFVIIALLYWNVVRANEQKKFGG